MTALLAKAWPVALRLALVVALVFHIHQDGQKAGRSEMKSLWDADRAATALQHAREVQQAADETRRREEMKQEIDRVANLARARDLAAAVAGAAAAERVRLDALAIAARGRDAPGDPEAARQCQSDKAALAEGLGRCGRDYARLDALWRATYTAGAACEQFADGLIRGSAD